MVDVNRIVSKITNSPNRKSFYHFTRVRNLTSIAHVNALYSCREADPALTQESRDTRKEIQLHGNVFVANAHLRIADQVMDAHTTQRQFQQYLDQHVFFWATLRSCQKMLEIYSKREPNEHFAVLQLDARSLLYDYFDHVKLSKYDSGSSPRYPSRCSYKKSLQMFLPIRNFEKTKEKLWPSKPSEILEVLVEGKITNVSRYLQSLYCDGKADIPGGWMKFSRPLEKLRRH